MKRIGILTAGGDTPALNATIHGAVVRANQRRVEMYGLLNGFNCIFHSRVPHIHLNPLFREIPELEATVGGTILGASRTYVDAHDEEALSALQRRFEKLGLDGLICIGGDGTLNGMQAIAERIPAVLAPKTIDNDLGLNYRSEPDEWVRGEENGHPAYVRQQARTSFELDEMVNYVTPGYATAVFVSASGIERVRTTAESHRRIAIIEVMGRHSGFIALGSSYGRPDLVLVPEFPVNVPQVVARVKEIYDLQQNVVIVVGEGITDQAGNVLGAFSATSDPGGNIRLSGAAEALRQILLKEMGNQYFKESRPGESPDAAIFTRKVGHTQRGGRPVLFDCFHAAQLGGKAVDMLLEGENNSCAILQWSQKQGFYVDSIAANGFRDRWGRIHAREMHASFYDAEQMRPSKRGVEYLLPIFSNALGHEDMEAVRQSVFDSGNLTQPYHSINTDINKRIRFLDEC